MLKARQSLNLLTIGATHDGTIAAFSDSVIAAHLPDGTVDFFHFCVGHEWMSRGEVSRADALLQPCPWCQADTDGASGRRRFRAVVHTTEGGH